MTEKIKNDLAADNNKQRELYVRRIHDRGRKEMSVDEQLARLRKFCYRMYSIMLKEHPSLSEDPAFREMLEFFDTFEKIKTDVKAMTL